MKVGTAVQVLPLTHPLRLAEETATVDQISGGRLMLGVGRSGNPRSYGAYGIPYSESRERFYETLYILVKAWTEDQFSYDGEFWHFDNARAVPRPFQKPHPPVRIAGASEDTFPMLGKLGFPLFVAVRSGSLSGWRPTSKPIATPGRGRPPAAAMHLRLGARFHRCQGVRRGQAEHHGGYKIDDGLEGSPNARRRAELEQERSPMRIYWCDKVVVGGRTRHRPMLQLQNSASTGCSWNSISAPRSHPR